jgi:hypothetical protein
MTRQELEAIFLLAGYDIIGLKMLPNGYHPSYSDTPWWEVETRHGKFVIGWRKRVISIDWSAIGPQPKFTNDNVTQDSTSIHAYGYGSAVNYLTELRWQNLDRIAKLPSPLPDGLLEEAKALFESADDMDVRLIVRVPFTQESFFRPLWEEMFETNRAVFYHRALGRREDAARKLETQ